MNWLWNTIRVRKNKTTKPKGKLDFKRFRIAVNGADLTILLAERLFSTFKLQIALDSFRDIRYSNNLLF